MALAWWFSFSFSYIGFKFLLHCVNTYWWNMSFKETLHCDGVAGGAVSMLLRFWMHAATLWRHAVWIRIVPSHNAWMDYEYSLSNLNRPRAIHKHNPHPPRNNGASVIYDLSWDGHILELIRKMSFYFHIVRRLRKINVSTIPIDRHNSDTHPDLLKEQTPMIYLWHFRMI